MGGFPLFSLRAFTGNLLICRGLQRFSGGIVMKQLTFAVSLRAGARGGSNAKYGCSSSKFDFVPLIVQQRFQVPD